MIVKIIGGAPFAVSIVLTVFMGGLGLGSYLASRTIDRVSEPLKLVRIYGLLELAIGAYGFVLPLLLTIFRPIYAVVYNQLFGHFMLYNLLTFVGCSVLLCIPVICMGATLPVLCRFYVTKLSHLGTHAGRLYGLNTIGAALGALVCGFWLINLFGVRGTLIFAVVCNGVIGLSCLLVSYKAKMGWTRAREAARDKQRPSAEDMAEWTEPPEYPRAAIGALIIFGVSGFCAMAYEVMWTRLLGLIVGPTTYSFTIVLVTFILALALGSMFFGWLADKTKKPMWLLIITQITAALFVLGVSQLIGNSQLFFAKLLFTFRHQFALLSILKALAVFAFMILPTFCLGATFPLVSKIYTRSVSKVGKSIGFAYAINTIGAVSGSFCAGFILIPLIGKENGLSFVIGLQLLTSLVIAVIAFGGKKERILKWVSVAVPALAGLFLCFHFPKWDRHLLSKGKYHRFEEISVGVKSLGWLEALLRGSKILSKYEHGELVYYGDGIGGFTTVLKYADSLGNIYYSMMNSGKADASSRADMTTQTLSAHFPMLFHRSPKTVMVLGLASGITAGEVLYYPIERLDVVDINREVVAGSDFFIPWNNKVLSNPKTNLIIQDGRAHLQLTKRKYDVISSEPSNPWMAGLAALFTRDFFELVKDRLNEEGIYVQFIHAYQMDWPTFALVGRTFAEVFPNSLLVATEPHTLGYDYLLVGLKGQGRLRLDDARRNLPYAQQSKNVTIRDARLLYRLIISEDLRRLFGQGPVNTDSRPRLEFAAPKLMYFDDPMIGKNVQSKRWLSSRTRSIIRQVMTDVDRQIDFAAYALSVYQPFRGMVDLSRATPSQKKRFFELMETYCASNSIDYSLFVDEELKRRCGSIQIKALQDKIDVMPNKAASYLYLANLYYEKGMPDKAVANFYKSLEISPYNAEAHSNLGAVLVQQGKTEKAIVHLTEALQIAPDNVLAHNNLGYALMQQGEFGEAIKHFTEALRIAPNFARARQGLEKARLLMQKRGR